jgi:hypothetical protein
MSFYQIITISISIVFIVRVLFLFIRGEKTIRELITTLFFWGVICFVGIFPIIITYFAKLLGFQLGVNALFVLSVVLIFFIEIRQSIKNDKLENLITKIVRENALKKIRKKNINL